MFLSTLGRTQGIRFYEGLRRLLVCEGGGGGGLRSGFPFWLEGVAEPRGSPPLTPWYPPGGRSPSSATAVYSIHCPCCALQSLQATYERTLGSCRQGRRYLTVLCGCCSCLFDAALFKREANRKIRSNVNIFVSLSLVFAAEADRTLRDVVYARVSPMVIG